MERRSKHDDPTVGSKAQVKDLLTHMDPMIYLAGTADNTSEMLSYLADMDPAFHKLELVKSLRKFMRENLSTNIEKYVDDYLQEQKGKMRSENPVDSLVERVTSSEEFPAIVTNIKENLETSVQDITNHFDDEIVTGIFAEEEDELAYNVSPNGSSESSLNSSLNQSGLLFLHPAQYHNIAKAFQIKRDLQGWTDSLNILIAVTPGEPVMQDCWPDIKRGLRECLFEDSEEVFEKSLKVHSKILTSQVHNAVKEAYLNLIEAVAGFYLSKRLISKIPLKEEPVDLKGCEKVLRIIKILVEFQRELPLLWIRYPERFIDDMVEATFSLLALNLGNKDSKHATVFDLYSIIDPQALWFRSWVHGQWGRNKTFSAMKSNSVVLLYSVSYCIQHLENELGDLEANTGNILNASIVQHLRFTFFLHFIMSVISFSDGRKLFPVNIPSKEELMTIQTIIQILVKAIDIKASKPVIMEISTRFQLFCAQDELKCWILCDSGVVESLLQEAGSLEALLCEKREDIGQMEIPTSFVQAFLSIMESILSTQMGQKYLLLGRKRKPSSKSGLSSVTSSPAHEIMDFILCLLKSKNVSSNLKRLCICVCCSLISSPIGVHICIEHPLFENLIEYLQEKSDSISPQKLPRGDAPRENEPLHLSIPQSLPLLTALLFTYKGVYLLESTGVLSLAVTQVLSEMARKGDVSTKVLSYICSSSKGCSLIGNLNILRPFWNTLCCKVNQEDELPWPAPEEDREEDIIGAMAPLTVFTSTFQGTQLLFSEEGLRDVLLKPLFSDDEMLEETHSIALHLLSSATSVLDSVAFLQASFKYQENLLSQQQHMQSSDGTAVIVDENSILRNHILVKSYMLGGSGERWVPPMVIEEFTSVSMPPLFIQYPLPREYTPEKPIKAMHKKQNDVWRFLTDTRHGLHDIGWLNHCRKAVRTVLMSGEDIKTWLVMDIVERAVRSILTSAEELLPGSPFVPPALGGTVTTSSSGGSSPSGLGLGQDMSSTLISQMISDPDDKLTTLSGTQLVAVELILRYGSDLQVLTGSGLVKENLINLLKFTQSTILLSTAEKCDWFTMVLFLVFGGNPDRCQSVLLNMSGLLIGGIMWPSFADSLMASHELLPGEVTLAGIIHNVQLVMSIELPILFMSIQKSATCLWSVVGEWVRCIFLGVLTWNEICHYLLLVLLQGPDYAVYFVVALLRHIQSVINKHAGSPKALIVLQTVSINGWRAGDHLNFMEVLSRRHRRTVLPALLTPFSKLRHQYTPRQL
nr:protein broad-minded-like [Penaeus vannamei]XP_027238866.1 protein broad-minded-like [Penaeus vannamei]